MLAGDERGFWHSPRAWEERGDVVCLVLVEGGTTRVRRFRHMAGGGRGIEKRRERKEVTVEMWNNHVSALMYS